MTRSGFPAEFIEDVRSRCDIVDVASKYITLNRRGSNFWACCPFHMEKTPSFSIKQDGQFFKCFGCGESGNVFNFIMKMENVDFLTAVEILCKQYGIELPTIKDNEQLQKKKHERDRVYQILKLSTEFYHNNLLNNSNSLQYKYLQSRGINDEMIKKFQIGASLDYDSLVVHLKKLGFKNEEMLMAGVVGLNDHGFPYDFYGTRLLFPIFNGFGDVVAYSGRAVDDKENRAKYKNTPQTIVFNKSEILFGYNFARDLKKEHLLDTLIIVEGHIDVISCHQAGITNTIGCMGTALTPLHAKKIKQLVDNVILCLDADNAGSMATYKAIDTLKEVGLNIKVVRLEGAKDPDEFIKKYGKENFLNELTNGQDCIDFILKDSAKKYDLNSNLDKSKYITEALNYISKFSTNAEQEIYLAEVQKLVKIPIDALRKSLKRETESVINSFVKENTSVETVKDNYILESKIMLLSSILYKKVKNLNEISELFDTEDELTALYNYLIEKINTNQEFSVSSLFDDFDINSKSLIDRVINYNFPPDDVYEIYLKETIAKIKLYKLEKLKKEVQQSLNKCSTQEEIENKLNDIKQLEIKIKEVKSGSNR